MERIPESAVDKNKNNHQHFGYDQVLYNSPVSDNQIAIKRKFGMREAVITKIEVIGTDIIIPNIPQIIPQKASASKTPSGLRFSVRPII